MRQLIRNDGCVFELNFIRNLSTSRRTIIYRYPPSQGSQMTISLVQGCLRVWVSEWVYMGECMRGCIEWIVRTLIGVYHIFRVYTEYNYTYTCCAALCTLVGNTAADGLKSVNDNIDGLSPTVLYYYYYYYALQLSNEMGWISDANYCAA